MRKIYLLHFRKSIGSEKHSAQHYVGSADLLKNRLNHHAKGTAGAAITNAFYRNGIDFALARTWDGTRDDERAMKVKDGKHFSRLCPICRGEKEYEPWQASADAMKTREMRGEILPF